jgi:putative transposase
MPGKQYKPEEIVAKLRQVDVETSQGQSVAEAIRWPICCSWAGSARCT